MKKCKHCQTEIDTKAKVCPNCRKKQGIPTVLIVILVIIGIIVISSIASSGSDDESKASGNTTTVEDLTLLDGHTGKVDSEYSYIITGTIKNNKDKDFSYVSVEFYTYDSDGNLLDTCWGNNSGLEANGTWKFEASCFFSNGNASDVASYKLKEIDKW
ncbi:MAG: hypothetical protein IJN03_02510 [Bacilli bacterium]|nr:hypothetical protein [Bacilli bacterium]